MGGYPLTQVLSRAKQNGATQEGEEDPWVAWINRLWEVNPYSNLLPIDPGEILSIFQHIWLDAFTHPLRLWTRYAEFSQQYMQIMTGSMLRFWGLGRDARPVVEPEPGDRRFSYPDWQINPVFDMLKQSYLLTATTLLRSIADIEGLDSRQRRKLTFYMRQFLDAISPSNFAFTNPEVIHETFASSGRNLVKGMQHLLRDLKEGDIKITDTDAFEVGRNLALSPGQVVYRNELIELIQYTPSTEQVYKIPLLFVPPWINKYYILDLRPQNSFVKFLVDRGFTVFVISWKNPDASMEHLSFDDYVIKGPVAALDVVKEITGSPKVNTVGYCIAGTLLATVPPYLESKGDDSINSVTFVVTLHDFDAAQNDMTLFLGGPELEYVEQQMGKQGYLDSRSMATMFKFLRANDLIWSNVVNNYLLGKEPPAFDLLYWNTDGTRMAANAHGFYLRNICHDNKLAKNQIVVKGVPINLRNIRQDVYAVGTEQDHIVPWKAAWRITELAGGKVRFVLGGSGHIAGIVCPPDKGKGYWTNDKPARSADEWLAGAEKHPRSWWIDWVEWLKPRSGDLVAPPPMGSEAHPPITPAPGTYVLEK